MKTDFVPENIEVWVDNWKRPNLISQVCESWLNSFPFPRVNVITNHPSVTINDFKPEIRDKIKIWPNVLRHEKARGPITKNINQAYVHTFLSGKKYCIVAHDSYVIKPGWADLVIASDYDLYTAPQGEGVHIQSLEGLKTFGWWDERYAAMGWHEIDYICRALRKSFILKEGKCSLVDYHRGWPGELNFVRNNELYYNTVGLENYFIRFSKTEVPQIGDYKNQHFTNKVEKWHYKKWKYPFQPQYSMYNITHGPMEEEIDWMPWLDLNNLECDKIGY